MPLLFNVSFPPTLVPHKPLLIEYIAFSKFISTPLLFRYAISCFTAQFQITDRGNDLYTGDHDMKDHIKPYLVVTGTGAAMSYRFRI